MHPRARHDRLGPAVGHRRPGKDDIAAIADRRIGRRQRQRLLDGKGFAGERRLVTLEGMDLREARVRRYAVAGLQQHDVAGDELPRRNARLRAVAQDPDRGRQHLLQRVEGIVRAIFLDEAQHGAEQHDHRDDRRVDDLSKQRREDRRDEQDDDERVLELGEEQRNRRGALFLRQLVRAELPEAILRLLRGQAQIETGRKAGDNFLQRLPVGSSVVHASLLWMSGFGSPLPRERPRRSIQRVWAVGRPGKIRGLRNHPLQKRMPARLSQWLPLRLRMDPSRRPPPDRLNWGLWRATSQLRPGGIGRGSLQRGVATAARTVAAARPSIRARAPVVSALKDASETFAQRVKVRPDGGLHRRGEGRCAFARTAAWHDNR